MVYSKWVYFDFKKVGWSEEYKEMCHLKYLEKILFENISFLFHLSRFRWQISTWIQDVNWTYIRRVEDNLVVLWTSYVRSIYILYPGECWKSIWTIYDQRFQHIEATNLLTCRVNHVSGVNIMVALLVRDHYEILLLILSKLKRIN